MTKKMILISFSLVVVLMMALVSCPLLPLDLQAGLAYCLIQTPGNNYQIDYVNLDDSSDPSYYKRTVFNYIDYTKEASVDYNGVYRTYLDDRMLKAGGRVTALYPTGYQYDRSNTNQRVLKCAFYGRSPGSLEAGYETSARWRFRDDVTADATYTVGSTVYDCQKWAYLGVANVTDDGFGWNWTCVFWDTSIDSSAASGSIGKVADMTIDFNAHTIDASVSDETPTKKSGMYITVIGDMKGEKEDVVLGNDDIYPY